MVAPLALAGGTMALSGLAGSIAQSRKKMRGFDPSPYLGKIESMGARERELVSSLRPQMKPLTEKMAADRGAAVTSRQAESRESSRKFLEDIGQSASTLGQNLFDVSKQRILETAPEQQQSLREALAGAGGLQRGGAASAMAGLSREQASQVGQAQQAIALQEQAARQQAISTVYGQDQKFITDALGVDINTIDTIFNSDREDIKTELAGLINELSERRNAMLAVTGMAQQSQLAQDAARRASQGELYQALTGLGSTALAASLTAPSRQVAPQPVGTTVNAPNFYGVPDIESPAAVRAWGYPSLPGRLNLPGQRFA